MPATMSQDLGAALRALLDEGYELMLTTSPGERGYLARLTGPLGSHATGTGGDPAAALASVWPPAGLDEDQADEDEPYCFTCGAPVGIFHGYGEHWYHWRGEATTQSPVELYDAGHEPEVAWRLAGTR